VLDFNFPIILHDKSGVKDCSMCSKGEQEMLNLAFALALCVHMSIGQKFPMRLDEVDSGFSAAHRDTLLGLLSTLLRQGLIRQLIIINHHSSLFSSFANAQIVCLNPEGIAVPKEYNKGVVMS
jgi:DNA repair exonuclease SbcCD ATPase subunit